MKKLFLSFMLSLAIIPAWSVEKKFDFLNTLELNYWFHESFIKEIDFIARNLKPTDVIDGMELNCLILSA